MARRAKTGFDTYLTAQLKRPHFKREYRRARREIDSVDALVRALDARREAVGLSKSELARRVGMKAEVVRRLFTVEAPNPTFDTVLRVVTGLDCQLTLRGEVFSEKLSRRRKTANPLDGSARV